MMNESHKQIRQLTTQTYEGRSSQTYVPHQYTRSNINAYLTEQRIEDIYRLLTESLKEMEYKYQYLEQTVLNMQHQSSQSGNRSGRNDRSQRPRPESEGNGQRYTRPSQRNMGREGNRERRITSNPHKRRQLSDYEDNYDVDSIRICLLIVTVKDIIQRGKATMEDEETVERDVIEDNHLTMMKAIMTRIGIIDTYLLAKITPPDTDDVNRRGGYQRN